MTSHQIAKHAEERENAAFGITLAALTRLLGLTECRFEAPPYEVELPVIERGGAVQLDRHHYTLVGFELPHNGVSLPVLSRGRPVGRFVLVPSPGTGPSLERRIVAVALADQAGATLGPAERSNRA